MLRRFVRMGMPSRSLAATPEQADGATVRRVLDAQAKRDGDLVRPNCINCARMGARHHLCLTGRAVWLTCIATAGNVADTLLFEGLFLQALALMASITTTRADRGLDAEASRVPCRRFSVKPCVAKRLQTHNSGLGTWRMAMTCGAHQCLLMENGCLFLQFCSVSLVTQSTLRAVGLFLVAGELA